MTRAIEGTAGNCCGEHNARVRARGVRSSGLASECPKPGRVETMQQNYLGLFRGSPRATPAQSLTPTPRVTSPSAQGQCLTSQTIRYCLGHLAYLAYFSTWLTLLLLSVALCRTVRVGTARLGRRVGFLISLPATQAED